jgi:16S rRNA (guanine966-N2)-methyltransferase
MPAKTAKGKVRIIAGEWRSRQLPVLDLPGLRPSSDRCRETLFNWLQQFIPGAKVVDLFAGTGALGFEAASRGASEVTMIENNAQVMNLIRSNMELLDATQVESYLANALIWLETQSSDRFDLIFVDPPFQDNLHDQTLEKIHQTGCLASGGLVYVESSALQMAPDPLAGWAPWREKIIGDVRLQVFRG